MDKFALITGASKGIGKGLAKVFAQHGYSLILIARNLNELQQVQSELKNSYQCASKILAVDLAEPSSITLIMDTFRNEMNQVEVLINNAGFACADLFTDIPLENTQASMNVNMMALTTLTYHVLPFMLANKRGKILNVASIAAYAPGPFMAVYYASKAYVLSFSQAICEEYRDSGICVSTLCPGVTNTNFSARAGLQNSLLFSGLLPAMTPEQVAELAYRGMMKDRRVIITGLINKITVFFMSIIPDVLLVKITSRLQKKRKQMRR